MGQGAAGTLSWSVALRLGRISNLPTVWSNTLVGAVLVGGGSPDGRFVALLIAMSLFYVAGMYLNDAFDWPIDAQERPERPIPAGEVGARTVFAAGFAMLAVALLILVWIGFEGAGGLRWQPVLAGLGLAAAIVYYDWRHKSDPLSPLWMGVCRMLIYVIAGLAIAETLPATVYLAAGVLLSYLIGLTYIAKQENLGQVKNLWPLAFLAVPVVYGIANITADAAGIALMVGFVGWLAFALNFLRRRRPGDIPRAVVSLIAGISLLDAIFIVAADALPIAWFAILAFALTLVFQRFVPGT